MFTIVLEPEAFQDLDEIAQWYREQGGDLLSERFLVQFYLAISKTTMFPNAYPFIYRQFQRVLLERYPFLVLFFQDRNEIHVIGVFHTSRDSTVWKKRV